MKIVYINKVKFPSPMPSTVFSTMNAYGFAENGAESWLLAVKATEQPAEDLFRSHFDLNPLPNFHIRLFPDKWLIWKTNEFFYLHCVFWLFRQPKGKIDVILTRDPGFLPYLLFVRFFRRNVLAVYQSHNFYLDIRQRPELNRVNRWKYHLIEKCCIPHLNGLLTLQSAQKSLYESHVSIPVYPGLPGHQNPQESFENKYEKKTAAYIGSFQSFKGIEAAVQIFANACPEDWQIVFIGGRNEREMAYVRNLAQSYGIQNRTELTGWLSHAELRKKLKQISIGLLLLSDTFYNRYLTAPSKLFDYLSAGIPVIATDLPSVSDFISHEKEALLAPPDDLEEATESLKRIVNDRKLYDRLALAAFQKSKSLSWKKRSKALLDFLKELRERHV